MGDEGMKKDYAVSSIRMIATILVVVLHIFQQMERTNPDIHIATDWLNLGLVLFFGISGFLYSGRKIGGGGYWFLHRYKELCLPSTIAVILTLVIYSVIYKFPGVKIALYSCASGLGFESFVPDAWMFIQYWFLTYILVCYLSVLAIQRLDVKKMSAFTFWSILLCASVAFQAIGFVLGRLGLPSLSWGVLLRFYLVYFLFRRYDTSEAQKRVFTCLTVCSLPMLIVTCIVRYTLQLDGVFAAGGELLFIYAQTLVGSVLFYWMYRFFTRYKFPQRLLDISDRYSYPVYLTHCLFIGYSTSVIRRFENTALGIAVALVCTAVASFALYKIVAFCKKALKGRTI